MYVYTVLSLMVSKLSQSSGTLKEIGTASIISFDVMLVFCCDNTFNSATDFCLFLKYDEIFIW